MAILHQLGINFTTLFCLVIFVITFFTLKSLVFTPYYNAFEEREKRTKGAEDLVKDLQVKTQEVKALYEAEAKDLNAEVKSIFDDKRATANKEYAKIVSDARADAEKYLEKTLEHVNAEIKKASDQLKVEAPSVALVITKKMLD